MFVVMGTVTTERFFQHIGLESWTEVFKEHDLGYEKLKDMQETALTKALKTIALSEEKQLKICRRIKELHTEGKNYQVSI